jgi:hypothetical protein
MENDVNEAPGEKSAITVSLSNIGGSNSELAFDDVRADVQAAGHRIWKQKAFYTKIAFANERLNSMALSNEEFQRIGETVVARLLALENRLK